MGQPAEYAAAGDFALEEQAFVAASRRGDVQAFNNLVVRYQTTVYNLAFRMLGDADAAADVAQDAFVSAFKGIGGFRGGSFKAWLLRITANGCYDVLRRQKRHPASSLDAMTDDEEAPMQFPEVGDGPEEIALRRELLAHIEQGLHELPPEQRLVVVLSDVQGLSYDEIAHVANCSLGTVKSRLSRGRCHLRDLLLRNNRELLPSRYRHE